MKTRTAILLVAALIIFQIPSAFAVQRGYFGQLGYTFARGVKNIVSSPWEIPYTIRKHDQTDNGNPRVFRDAAGFFDGILRTLTRLGDGVWDLGWAFVPGEQEGLPLEPETFF
jgi:hypothetical protein